MPSARRCAQVGARVTLTRSGHSPGAADDHGRVVAVDIHGPAVLCRVRWTNGMETVVPAGVLRATPGS
jgi:hypothetical protein